MAAQSEVVVYGVPVGETRPQRLGTGSLQLSQLVLVDPPLEAELASSRPPWVLRVGIGSFTDDDLMVEVIEVLQVLQSVETRGETMWALELTEAAQSRVEFGRPSPPARRERPSQQRRARWICPIWPTCCVGRGLSDPPFQLGTDRPALRPHLRRPLPWSCRLACGACCSPRASFCR